MIIPNAIPRPGMPERKQRDYQDTTPSALMIKVTSTLSGIIFSSSELRYRRLNKPSLIYDPREEFYITLIINHLSQYAISLRQGEKIFSRLITRETQTWNYKKENSKLTAASSGPSISRETCTGCPECNSASPGRVPAR